MNDDLVSLDFKDDLAAWFNLKLVSNFLWNYDLSFWTDFPSKDLIYQSKDVHLYLFQIIGKRQNVKLNSFLRQELLM